MDNKVVCKHRVLAGFMAFLMFWSLLISGTLFAVRGGLFGERNIRELMRTHGMDRIFYDFCDDIIDSEFKEQDLQWIVENKNYQEIKEEVVGIFLDSVFVKNENVNLDGVVNKLMDTLESESEVIVDNIFDEIEKQAENFDARTDAQIQQIVSTYDIQVDESFYDQLNTYADKASEIDKYRDEIKAEIDSQVIEPVTGKTDEFKSELEAVYMEAINEYYESEAFSSIEITNKALKIGSQMIMISAILFLGMSVFFMIVLCMLYKDGLFGAFSKLAIVSGISGVLIMMTGLAKYFVRNIVNQVKAEDLLDMKETMAANIHLLIDKLMALIFNPFIIVGIVYLVIMVLSIIIWGILKKRYKAYY